MQGAGMALQLCNLQLGVWGGRGAPHATLLHGLQPQQRVKQPLQGAAQLPHSRCIREPCAVEGKGEEGEVRSQVALCRPCMRCQPCSAAGRHTLGAR